ncbi:hypothetical protein BGZ57DRAFT_908665 [Hyaloscypha finlandica]|nr:hypothetical protein BGZ57DRAFT_908665 [Hyaloscypha finlandica]
MLLIFIAFLSFSGGNSSISCLLRKLGLCVARGGPRDLFFLGGICWSPTCHVLAHMTPLLYLSSGHPMAHLSFLQHLDYHTLLQYTMFIL